MAEPGVKAPCLLIRCRESVACVLLFFMRTALPMVESCNGAEIRGKRGSARKLWITLGPRLRLDQSPR
jgi:hypothetical protein